MGHGGRWPGSPWGVAECDAGWLDRQRGSHDDFCSPPLGLLLQLLHGPWCGSLWGPIDWGSLRAMALLVALGWVALDFWGRLPLIILASLTATQ